MDGAGDDSRFGVWRLFDLAAGLPEVLSPAVSRIVNQSRHSLDRIAGVENPLAPPNPYNHQRLVAFVPNDVGVPTDLASFGTQVSYIANLPFIGLEAIIPAQMDSRVLVDAQVQAMFRSPVDPTNPLAHINQTIPIRAVDTIAVGGGFVVAGGQRLASDVLFLTDPGLNLLDTLVLPEGGRVVAVKGLARWPTRTDPASTVTQPRDLVVAMCPNAQRGAVNLHVVAVNPAAGSSPGSPRGRFVGTGSSTT